jgi:hypothetical protein
MIHGLQGQLPVVRMYSKKFDCFGLAGRPAAYPDGFYQYAQLTTPTPGHETGMS